MRFEITRRLDDRRLVEAVADQSGDLLRLRATLIEDGGVAKAHRRVFRFDDTSAIVTFETEAGLGPLFPADMFALKCPAAPPHWPDAVVWGIAGGTPDEPRVVPLASPQPLTESLLREIEPCTPREVFRIAATCIKANCPHWRDGHDGAENDGRCSLVERVVDEMREVALQPCSIRSICRWFAQESAAACRSCPGVVTDLGELPQDAESETEVDFF